MAEAYVGEIRMVGFNFAPIGWALCNGQILPISQNTALFSLLGTTYGGNGTTTFALPDLQNRTPIHKGQGPGLSPYSLGESGGASTVTLQQSQLSAHAHAVSCDPAIGTQQDAAGAVWASSGAGRTPPAYYANAVSNLVAMSPSAIAVAGGRLPHNNRSPYLGVTFIIALQGIYPPRS
jgi:microcystin-dependent protein